MRYPLTGIAIMRAYAQEMRRSRPPPRRTAQRNGIGGRGDGGEPRDAREEQAARAPDAERFVDQPEASEAQVAARRRGRPRRRGRVRRRSPASWSRVKRAKRGIVSFGGAWRGKRLHRSDLGRVGRRRFGALMRQTPELNPPCTVHASMIGRLARRQTRQSSDCREKPASATKMNRSETVAMSSTAFRSRRVRCLIPASP